MASNCTNLIAPNPDIAGIGIRINFYATILLQIPLVPDTELTTELLDGIFENAVFLGLSLVITAVIQTIQGQLDLYHAIFVMQFIFYLDFVYAYGMRRFSRSRNALRTFLLFSIQMLSTAVFTIWSLYVWTQNSRFGSQPECNHVVEYVLFFATVDATATWLRALFIVGIVFAGCSLLLQFGTVIVSLKTNPSKVDDTGRKSIYRLLTLPLGSAIYGVVTLELIVRRNQPIVGSGESAWGFGQIVSLILMLQFVVDSVVTINTWWRTPMRTSNGIEEHQLNEDIEALILPNVVVAGKRRAQSI
ncbi:hypothetical protein V8E53_012203 [Lactarius tabidus]